MIKEAIKKLVEYKNLEDEEAVEVMGEIMSGQASEAQIASLLTALHMKGETVGEIAAFAEVMRSHCIHIRPRVNGRIVDTCGTGGDMVKTFNVSTAAAFVVAGAGVAVAKHGNRSVTSQCGSADVLEALGLNLNAEPSVAEQAIERLGIGFLFAPKFHPAMKYASGARREIGIRTVFNILGPLTNPAGASAQLLGVYDAGLVEPMAHVLARLGVEEAMVVHGVEGVDEVSMMGPTLVAWLRGGGVRLHTIGPHDFKLPVAKPEEVMGMPPEESAVSLFRILYNSATEPDLARRNMVLANAAAALVVGGKVRDFEEGVEVARESIESGSAYHKLRELIKLHGGSPSKLEELEAKLA